MSKPELGLKRTCVTCAVRFYDLLRSPAVCPKCDAPQPALVPRVLRRPTAIKAEPARTPEEAADEVLVATDEDEDAPETDDDLDDDDTDLPADLGTEAV